VVAGARILVRAGRRQRQWRTYPGRVVASRLDEGHFQFQVAFDHDGREIRFWNPYTTTLGVDPVGRDVEVLVNPADPSQAVVREGQSRPEVAGVGFLVFGVCGHGDRREHGPLRAQGTVDELGTPPALLLTPRNRRSAPASRTDSYGVTDCSPLWSDRLDGR
jgi:hypothetical protein